MGTLRNELREQWEKLGYDPKCGSAAVLPPPPPHLLRVYYFTSADHAINNIALGRIKLARFAKLNDPFELLAPNFGNRPDVREAVVRFRNEMDSHSSLLCFSADWRSPVLWSHYGKQHEGICLGFNIDRTRAHPITYIEDRIAIPPLTNGIPFALTDDLKRELLYSKFMHWKYEDEWRVLISLADAMPERGHHFYHFAQGLQLAEVILGMHCSIALDDVRALVQARYPDAFAYGSRAADKWFIVVPEEDTLL